MKEEVGVSSFKGFDYRAVVRERAGTLDEYRKIQDSLPLRQAFVDCQLQLAAENTKQLGELASEIVRRPITLSVNTGLPWLPHLVVAPYLTHLVCEVRHNAHEGTKNLMHAVEAYRMAEAIGKPMASTASGQDWARVKEKEAVNLVKVWIALSYSCGQRLMVPHRQWCFTQEKGTHWYEGPTEEFAPLYRFVRVNRDLFRDTHTVGPLVPPKGIPSTLETQEKRDRLMTLLQEGEPKPISAGEQAWVFPRLAPDESGVIHIVNLDYETEDDEVVTHSDLNVTIPLEVFPREYQTVTFFSPDREEVSGEVAYQDGQLVLTVPKLEVWTVARME
jgi:hypothetical protein